MPRPAPRHPRRWRLFAPATLLLAVACGVAALLYWSPVGTTGQPWLTSAGPGVGALNIGVLVFREGLECVLVLAAVLANRVGTSGTYRAPITVGAGAGFAASLITWLVAVRLVDDLGDSLPALQVQALTGLLAVIVLIVVMNWFFHKVYWTGWIALHTNKKRALLTGALTHRTSTSRLLLGLGLLGFTSVYREGFEVVLFLQSYRLRLGDAPVFYGVVAGLALTAAVAVLTFVAHRRLPYRKMLVLTGVLLGAVLLVMVGEQAQEMQLAHWLPTTPIRGLARLVPNWMGLWFSIFPTVETLTAQIATVLVVVGSYFIARRRILDHSPGDGHPA